MRYALALFLILATAGLGEAKKKKKVEVGPPPCVDEEGMITYYHGQMTELLGKVKQEDVGPVRAELSPKTGREFPDLLGWRLRRYAGLLRKGGSGAYDAQGSGRGDRGET